MKVLCFTTGGTIASQYEQDAAGFFPSISGPALLERVPGVTELAEVEVIQLSQSSSHVFTPSEVFDWTGKVRKGLREDDVAGAVITHGTDTLEESAYLFDLVLNEVKPVVFTGAMRAYGEPGSDGPRNLADAILTALSQQVRGLGVLVVMNREVHAARDVTKQDSETLDAFASPGGGWLGRILSSGEGDEVVITRHPSIREHVPTDRIEPNVEYVKVVMGSGSEMLNAAIDLGARGIVVETFAGGEITPYMIEGLQRALRRGVRVVIASSAQRGRPTDLWTEPGAGGWMRQLGVLLADDISGPKARIKLMLSLGSSDEQLLRHLFR